MVARQTVALQSQVQIQRLPSPQPSADCKSPEPVVRVAIWRINREIEHGQSAVSGEAAPMLHVFSSYRRCTC
jgi:hypothetical protein